MEMTDQQKEARLALIKEVHKKFQRRKAFKDKMAAQNLKTRRWTEEVEKPKRKAKVDIFYEQLDKMDENHNQWTDAPQYAEKYYGERMRATTKFDNDWN